MRMILDRRVILCYRVQGAHVLLYSFITIGPVSPLSFSGTPLFFNAFNQSKRF